VIPDIELQLQVILKSLKDNVGPAISKDDALAQQQFQLGMAALEITIGHLPYIHKLLRKDIQLHCNLAKKLIVEGDGDVSLLQILQADCLQTLADPNLGASDLQKQARLLRDGIGNFISAQPDLDAAGSIGKAILATSEEVLLLGRSWNKPMGFEPAPKSLADISQLLA